MTDSEFTDWLDISRALFRDLIPVDLVKSALMGGLTSAEHAFLAHREEKRVDEALISMSLADGEEGVKAVFAQLSDDTVIALASRWAHYSRAWNTDNGELRRQELSPGLRSIWPAIFLSMTTDRAAAEAAAERLDQVALVKLQRR